jgi:hypothetical protein
MASVCNSMEDRITCSISLALLKAAFLPLFSHHDKEHLHVVTYFDTRLRVLS